MRREGERDGVALRMTKLSASFNGGKSLWGNLCSVSLTAPALCSRQTHHTHTHTRRLSACLPVQGMASGIHLDTLNRNKEREAI